MYNTWLTIQQQEFLLKVFNKKGCVLKVSEMLDWFYTRYGIFISIIFVNNHFNWHYTHIIKDEKITRTDVLIHHLHTFNQCIDSLLGDLQQYLINNGNS